MRLRTNDEVVSSITLIVNEVKRRAEALSCNKVAGKPEGRNGNSKTVSAISLFRQECENSKLKRK